MRRLQNLGHQVTLVPKPRTIQVFSKEQRGAQIQERRTGVFLGPLAQPWANHNEAETRRFDGNCPKMARISTSLARSPLTSDLACGGTISLRGADNYDSLRGDGLDFIVLDEYASMAPEAWTEVLQGFLGLIFGHPTPRKRFRRS